MTRILAAALAVQFAALPVLADDTHFFDTDARKSIISNAELYALPPEVANRMIDLLAHGDRYAGTIRQTVDYWQNDAAYSDSHCGGPIVRGFAGPGV